MDDAIKHFMKETQSSGLFRELHRREYFMSRIEWRKLKDRRAQAMRKKAEAKKIRHRHFYDEKR